MQNDDEKLRKMRQERGEEAYRRRREPESFTNDMINTAIISSTYSNSFSLAIGLRASNVIHLKWSNVDLQKRCAWIDANESKKATKQYFL